MTSINDLLGKKPKAPTPKAPTEQPKQIEQPKKPGLKLNFGSKKDENKNTKEPVELVSGTSDNIASDVDPFASLGNVLDNVSFDVVDVEQPKESNLTPVDQDKQFQNPTLSDVEKFVFEEQPDHSTQEITDIFSNMIDDLSTATGDQVPTNVSRCLKFIKEHAFLADILKPEAIGILTNGLRRSYGFIVKAKTEKSEKKKARQEKVSEVLDSLSDLNF